ncbi:MAG: hypothetical protein FWC16_05635 [Defluviitaleaceae bacterium]|nr:hypothetical protein [Defluviitaleaceae bacterium]MCL2274391.1 hypothetical protein [Defluviitaleaceae bacterium]
MRITSSMMHNTHAMLHRRTHGMWNNGMPARSEEELSTLLRSAANFVFHAGPRATSLRNTLNAIPDIVARQNAVSNDTDVVRVRSCTGRAIPETKVNVIQLALTQRNEGVALPADETAFEAGTFNFEIEMDGETHTISFTTTEPLTNRAFQQRMAAAINQSPVALNATVTNGENGTSHLNLETATTGAGNDNQPRFSIQDVQGNAVAATEIDTITRGGQNALFTINDDEEPRSSASNNVTLPGSIEVTLAGTGEATIAGRREAAVADLAIRQMVDDINAFLEIARTNQGDNRSRALLRDIQNQLRRGGPALQQIGITMNNNGMLTVNAARLREATENGTAERILGTNNDRPSAFVTNLRRTSDSVARNPLHHINQRVPRTPGFNAALSAVANPAAIAQQVQPSPFDVYFEEDPWGNLWNAQQ